MIGNITVYGDEIPIHELDMIFDSEGAKYRDLNEDKQSETSSVTSPPRVTSIGKQLLRDNPSSAAELLTRVQSPAKTLGRTHKKSIDMLPCNRRRHFVEIAEDENDLANILTELCRLGVVESAPNSPRKSKQVSVADKSEDMRPTSLLSEISSSIVDGDSIRITSGDHTLLPTSSSEVTTCEEPEQTVPLERASSSEAEPLEPKELFHPSDDVLEYEDESLNDSPPPEVSILSNERKSLEQSQLSDTAVTLDVPSEPVLDTNSSGSPPRRVAQSRWTKNKTQQYLPVDPFLVSRTSESSSVSQSIPGKLGSVDGDAVSLYSSEDPQISAIKSTSSPIKSNEPEDILESNNNSNRNASYEMKIPIPSYTGSEDYVNLSVSDHLQQYFTEQVFGHGRPSGEAPYMRYESLSKDSLNDQSGYVDVPSEPERLVALYREIVIEISDTSKSQSTGQSKANKKTSKKHLQGGEYDSEVVYMPIVFALTDINLYVIIDNFSNLHKFVDAPIPVVRRIHRIECCR